MYKKINILLLITVLNTLLFAKVTNEDVEKYLKISRGGTIVKYTFLFEYREYFSRINSIDIKKANKQTIKKYKSFIFNSKYEDIFFKTFSELDDTSYFEIMAFYKTKLGKKYAQTFRELYKKDIAVELIGLILEKNNNIVLPKKRNLVIEINKALYSRYYMNIEKNIFFKTSGGVMLEYVNSHKIVPQTVNDEYFEVFNELAYKDFSNEELSQILEYAKTYGKIEMGVLHHALKVSIDALEQDLNNFIKSKKSSKNLDNNSSK